MTIVETLKSLLARAENGEFSGIAIAVCNTDLCTASVWSMEDATLAELLGSVAILNARLLDQVDGRRDR